MSDPRAGSRKGMRNGFSTLGECPEGMWEWEHGCLVGGGPKLRNVGECQTDLGEMEWEWRDEGTGGVSGLERCRKRNPQFMPKVQNPLM